MLKTELRAKFLGFLDGRKAVLAQGEKLEVIDCWSDASKKLRGCQYKTVALTIVIRTDGVSITNADPLEDPGEDNEEADNEE